MRAGRLPIEAQGGLESRTRLSLRERICAQESLQFEHVETRLGSFADMHRINRYFGAHRILRRLLRSAGAASGPVSVLDIGAGAGDGLDQVRRLNPEARCWALDWQPDNLKALGTQGIASDVRALPFAPESVDFVLLCTLLHEFDTELGARVLQSAWRVARRALIVTDLERRWIPYLFLPATRRLFGWRPITVSDGQISVAAAYRRDELLQLAAAAGLPGPRCRVHYPWFRLSLVVRR